MEQIINKTILEKIKKIKGISDFRIKDSASSDNNTFDYWIELNFENEEFEFILEFKRVRWNSYILLANKIIAENVNWTLFNEIENCEHCGSEQSYYSDETIINNLPPKLTNKINNLIKEEKANYEQ